MANEIMTQTLPTVIGMGVVSRTTETMFKRGKNGRGKVRTAKAKPAKSRSHKTQTRKVKGRVVHKGTRGGKYIVKQGRKIYL